MPKAIVLSDLHFEWNKKWFVPKIDDVKYLILAGDIGSFDKHLPFIEDAAKKYTVLYVLGNHEFYGHSLKKVRDFWSSVKIDNFYFLDNSFVVIDDIKFVGSTLWVNFFNEDPHCIMNAPIEIKDFSKIINNEENDYISPYDILEEYKKSFAFIEKELYEEDGFKKVLVTHYAVSHQSIPEQYKVHQQDLKNNHYFANNLDYFIGYSGAALAVHGHLHTSADYFIGDTRVVCNPFGYPDSNNPSFEMKVIDF
jgi:hypothetical protein